jgi:tryptophan synthase beta chain
MMEMHGASVLESPSNTTNSGLQHFNLDANHPGSLGIAISEAIESIMSDNQAKYALGSVLDSVLLHQTVIGEEAINQLNDYNIYPDVVVGCVGGGSNFGGIAFPFLKQKITQNKDIRFIAVEPESCPTLTKGELKYDFGDTSGLTPLLYMYSLGKDFIPPSIHAGGLRYHGMSPLVSHLYSKNIIEAAAQSQDNVFKAARLFFETEGILPAPESSHAIATVIEEALQAKRDKKKKTILFNLSGHGFFDINAFENN